MPNLMKALVIVFSFHHKNTEKIAQVFAQVLDAPLKTPRARVYVVFKVYNIMFFMRFQEFPIISEKNISKRLTSLVHI
jgi:hypothetical protein